MKYLVSVFKPFSSVAMVSALCLVVFSFSQPACAEDSPQVLLERGIRLHYLSEILSQSPLPVKFKQELIANARPEDKRYLSRILNSWKLPREVTLRTDLEKLSVFWNSSVVLTLAFDPGSKDTIRINGKTLVFPKNSSRKDVIAQWFKRRSEVRKTVWQSVFDLFFMDQVFAVGGAKNPDITEVTQVFAGGVLSSEDLVKKVAQDLERLPDGTFKRTDGGLLFKFANFSCVRDGNDGARGALQYGQTELRFHARPDGTVVFQDSGGKNKAVFLAKRDGVITTPVLTDGETGQLSELRAELQAWLSELRLYEDPPMTPLFKPLVLSKPNDSRLIPIQDGYGRICEHVKFSAVQSDACSDAWQKKARQDPESLMSALRTLEKEMHGREYAMSKAAVFLCDDLECKKPKSRLSSIEFCESFSEDCRIAYQKRLEEQKKRVVAQKTAIDEYRKNFGHLNCTQKEKEESEFYSCDFPKIEDSIPEDLPPGRQSELERQKSGQKTAANRILSLSHMQDDVVSNGQEELLQTVGDLALSVSDLPKICQDRKSVTALNQLLKNQETPVQLSPSSSSQLNQ